VQVGTASYADPRAVERIAKGLEHWCVRHHVETAAELTGKMELTAKPKDTQTAAVAGKRTTI